ncbi:signal recognition particle subunit srp68 [Phlyctochytrium bullatum]|nr:signal recognition particle subunit srp68 [Phlyctochytrium bullatum]
MHREIKFVNQVCEGNLDLRMGDDTTMEDAAPLRLSVLSLTHNARNEHGLRHQDYQRYRKYCTRKVEKVRKIVGLHQRPVKGKKLEKKPITSSVVKSARHLEILLFNAERYWSYAMELKRESASEPRKRHHLIRKLKRAAQAASQLEQLCQEVGAEDRTTFDARAYAAVMEGYVHLEKQEWGPAMDRFAAARTIYDKMATAGTLSTREMLLCQSAMDAIDPNIHFCAYNLRLRAGPAGKQAQQDIAALIQVRSQASGSDASGLEILASQVEEVLSKTRREKAQNVHELAWRKQSVETRNSKLIEALIAADDAVSVYDGVVKSLGPISAEDRSLNSESLSKRLDGLEKIIGAYWDATKLAESDLREDAVDCHFPNQVNYVSFLRLRFTIERIVLIMDATCCKLANPRANDLVVIGGDRKPPNPEDLVRQSDAVIQTLSEMADLPTIQQDPTIRELIRWNRASHIAELLTSSSRYYEANAMFERAMEHLTMARAELPRISNLISRSGVKEDEEELSALEALQKNEEKRALAGSLSCYSKGFLFNLRKNNVNVIRSKLEAITLKEENTSVKVHLFVLISLFVLIIRFFYFNAVVQGKTSKPEPISSRLDEFPEEFEISAPNLVSLPPLLEPVACKPVFFDIAFNKLDYPVTNLTRRISGRSRLTAEQRQAAEAAPAKEEDSAPTTSTGLTGFLSGIWGRR